MREGSDLAAPELDQPVLELQSGLQTVAQASTGAVGTAGPTLPVSAGGTGSSTAAGALANLGAAPSNATYITQTASAGLSAEQALAALATGYLKSTTGTGVLTTQAIPLPSSDLSALGLLDSRVVNLNTNTKQSLYTVPGGKSTVPVMVVLRGPSVDLGAGGLTNLNFGFNPGASDWTAGAITVTDLTASTMFKVIDQTLAAAGGTSIIGTAGQVFGLITDAAYGSPATITVDTFGREF